MLVARGLAASYGQIKALHGIDLDVHEGEAVCLIGANGAGKTTLMRVLAGLHPPAAGTVRLDGRDVTGRRAEAMVRFGLSLVPEGRDVFPGLSVEDNLRLGGYRRGAKEAEADVPTMFELFPVLADRRDQYAGTMSGGEQQMLAIARGLMSRPRVLLLDEPSLGLAPIKVREVVATLQELAQRGTTILLVEQNARAALKIAGRGYVLVQGEVIAEGPTEALLADPAVREAYLGSAA
jgi:branched-chain amino acid transport system ATP-binding protein